MLDDDGAQLKSTSALTPASESEVSRTNGDCPESERLVAQYFEGFYTRSLPRENKHVLIRRISAAIRREPGQLPLPKPYLFDEIIGAPRANPPSPAPKD